VCDIVYSHEQRSPLNTYILTRIVSV